MTWLLHTWRDRTCLLLALTIGAGAPLAVQTSGLALPSDAALKERARPGKHQGQHQGKQILGFGKDLGFDQETIRSAWRKANLDREP